jgi:hypothetical protein
MSCYIRKLGKNKQIKDLYYYAGLSIHFKFAGDRSWRINKKLENFSCDDHIVWEGEDENGHTGDVVGINKGRWRYSNE